MFLLLSGHRQNTWWMNSENTNGGWVQTLQIYTGIYVRNWAELCNFISTSSQTNNNNTLLHDVSNNINRISTIIFSKLKKKKWLQIHFT